MLIWRYYGEILSCFGGCTTPSLAIRHVRLARVHMPCYALCVRAFRAVFDGESVDRNLARSMSCDIAKRPKMFVRIWLIVRIFDRLSNVIRILDRGRDGTTHNLISKPKVVRAFNALWTKENDSFNNNVFPQGCAIKIISKEGKKMFYSFDCQLSRQDFLVSKEFKL